MNQTGYRDLEALQRDVNSLIFNELKSGGRVLGRTGLAATLAAGCGLLPQWQGYKSEALPISERIQFGQIRVPG